MLHRPASRALSLLWALWFAFATTAVTSRPCPEHDGIGAPHGTMQHMPPAHAMHHSSNAPSHEHHACTCIGSCCGVGAVDQHRTSVAELPEPRIIRAVGQQYSDASAVASRILSYLPFSNGPPAIA